MPITSKRLFFLSALLIVFARAFCGLAFFYFSLPTAIPGAAPANQMDARRVRASAATDSPIVGRLNDGDQDLARTENTKLWQIAFPDTAHRAWLAAQGAALLDPTATLPVLRSAPNTSTTLPTETPPNTRTYTPTRIFTATPTFTPVSKSTSAPTNTPSATPTHSLTATPTNTPTSTPSPTPTNTPTNTSSPTPTNTPTPTFTITPTPSQTPIGSNPSRALIAYDVDMIIVRNATTWYRFEYRGDRTPINIGLSGYGARDLEMLVYTPAQVESARIDPNEAPVGRGGGNKAQTGYDLYWTGAFPIEGTYYIAIINQTDHAILYRLVVSGPSVTASAVGASAAREQESTEETPNLPRTRIESSTNSSQLPVVDYLEAWISLGIMVPDLREAMHPTTIYTVFFPPELGIPPMPVAVPSPPEKCTPPEAVSVIITESIKLCPGNTYYNLNLSGKEIGIFSDDAGTAIVKSEGRSFAVTAVGENLLIQGLKIQSTTDPNDADKWLCAYDHCGDGPAAYPGGTIYGGGILLKASGSLIKDVTVTGGTTGIATIDGVDNFIINNRLQYQTGWASYNRYSVRTHFLGNAFNYSRRSCVGLDRRFYQNGCETAGWLCISCVDIKLIDNECRRGGNCYYVNGDGGVPSFNIAFFRNTCYGSPNNCYEATYSKGVSFEKNVATRDPYSKENCNYPFWVGESQVIFGPGNDWACTISPTVALRRSQGDVPSSSDGGDDSGKRADPSDRY